MIFTFFFQQIILIDKILGSQQDIKMLEWLFGKKKQEPQPKPKKSKKEQEAEDKWMYDFMVQFLSSPIWRVSLLDFVDNKCIVFDNEEENKFQYTIIHNQFKELVGNLVDGMMEQIGMSQQKLAQILQKGFASKQKKLFNQILLADDFLRFKELMVKRNKALEQEALKALQQSQLKSPSKKQKIIKNYDQQQLLRESQRLEDQRQKKIQQQEEQMLRKAIQMSKISQKESTAIKELEKKATDKIKEQEKPKREVGQKAEKSSNFQQPSKQKSSKLESLKSSSVGNKITQVSDLPPLKSINNKNIKNEEVFSPAKNSNIEEPKKEVKQPEQVPVIVQKEDKPQEQSMQDRKQRLLAQRQKIRKQKQQERKKQLELQSLEKDKETQQAVNTVVLQEDGFYDSNFGKKEVSPVVAPSSVSEDELKRRRELMNKIKNRIIDDF